VISFKIFDIPNADRKIHLKPIPLGGGAGLLVSMFIAMAAVYFFGWLNIDKEVMSLLWGLLVAGIIIVFGGLIDDKFNLKWWQQLLFPVAAVAIMLATGLEIPFVTNPFGEGLLYLDEIRFLGVSIGYIFLGIWLIGMMYTTKLLDGIDGLTSSISGIAALVIFVVSLTWDNTGSTTSFLAIALVGTTFGYLIWNWHPAKIFLGEGGSVYLGFMLGVLAIISGGKIATALLVMGIPILDVIWIIIRRLRAGTKLYKGDALHLHFRLLKTGLSQKQVVLFLSVLSLLFGSVSFFASTRGKLIALVVLIIVMIILALILNRRDEKILDT